MVQQSLLQDRKIDPPPAQCKWNKAELRVPLILSIAKDKISTSLHALARYPRFQFVVCRDISW